MSENKSRIERYAKLRQDLIDQQQHTIETKELSVFANQLNQLDDEHFKRMDVDTEVELHAPLHLRSQRHLTKTEETLDNQVPAFEKQEIQPSSKEVLEFPNDPSVSDILEAYEPEEIADGFVASYVDEVLSEVKTYNVEKGYRKKEDTRSNVLSSVLPTAEYEEVSEIENQLRRDQHQIRRPIPGQASNIEEVSQDLDETIKLQVEELAQLDVSLTPLATLDQPTEVFELKEATEQMKVLIEQQDEAVKTLDKKIKSSNTFINVLLGVVILLFVIVFFALIYITTQLV